MKPCVAKSDVEVRNDLECVKALWMKIVKGVSLQVTQTPDFLDAVDLKSKESSSSEKAK